MSMSEASAVLGWSRMTLLIACFAGAAYLDNRDRRIPNSYWITWSKSAVLIWTLDLLIRGADWATLCTAAAVLAYGSTALIGTPTLEDLKAGSFVDWTVTTWYAVGALGIAAGTLMHGSGDITAMLFPEQGSQAALWVETLLVLPVMFIIRIAWRFRLIHGGADAKALLLVAVLMPNWATFQPLWGEPFMPPVFSLLVWGGLGFILLPLYLLIRNGQDGNLNSGTDLRMAWHATKMPLDEIPDRFVWLLDEVADLPSGERGIISRMKPPSRTPTPEVLNAQLDELAEAGAEEAWVTQKYPLLTYIFPGTFLLLIFGDPMSWILGIIGLA